MPAAATTHNENNKVEADHGRQENEWGLRLGGWGGKAEFRSHKHCYNIEKKSELPILNRSYFLILFKIYISI